LTTGTEFIAVYTDSFFIRLFSIYGSQKNIISACHVIAMTAFENHLAYVYHNGTPLFGSQTLRIKILDSDKFFSEVYDGILSISPFSTLIWFGYSEGIIFIYLRRHINKLR
jgi:hypothetical protein